MVLVTL